MAVRYRHDLVPRRCNRYGRTCHIGFSVPNLLEAPAAVQALALRRDGERAGGGQGASRPREATPRGASQPRRGWIAARINPANCCAARQCLERRPAWLTQKHREGDACEPEALKCNG
jgi:hypothetical protein